ncbi:unnamed protein product [Lampetra fluviatilis]
MGNRLSTMPESGLLGDSDTAGRSRPREFNSGAYIGGYGCDIMNRVRTDVACTRRLRLHVPRVPARSLLCPDRGPLRHGEAAPIKAAERERGAQ